MTNPVSTSMAALIKSVATALVVAGSPPPSHHQADGLTTAIAKASFEVGCALAVSGFAPIQHRDHSRASLEELMGGICRDTVAARATRYIEQELRL